MAVFVYNTAKGVVGGMYKRVDENDPATAVLRVQVLGATGIETDAVLEDKDDMAAVVAGTTAEVTNTGYTAGGKILTDTDIVAFAPDDTNNRVDLDIPDQTWTGVSAGDNWSDLVVAYDAVGTNVAANVVPMTQHDFIITPDGSDITAQINVAGFFRAE